MFRVLLPGISAAREAARRAKCANDFQQIGIAIHNYHDVYQRIPPAYLADENGNAIQSWRLLIIYFLVQTNIYGDPFDAYDRRQPWDSPKNKPLADHFVAKYGNWFHCASAFTKFPPGTADFVAIVGRESAFDGASSIAFSDIKGGLANLILIAEIANSDIYWTEPRDMRYDAMSFRINDPAHPSISSRHRGGAQALYADGSVHFLSNETDPAVVRALCTRAAKDKSGLVD